MRWVARCAGFGGLAGSRFMPERNVGRDGTRFQGLKRRLAAIPRIGQHVTRVLTQRGVGLIDQRQEFRIVRGAVGQARRDNHLGRFIDGELPVVALIEAGRGLHDPALGIGEVILGVIGRHPEIAREGFVPRPLRPSSGVRPFSRSSAACRASRRAFAAAIFASRSSRRCNSAGNSSPRTSGPCSASSAASAASPSSSAPQSRSRNRRSSWRIRP